MPAGWASRPCSVAQMWGEGTVCVFTAGHVAITPALGVDSHGAAVPIGDSDMQQTMYFRLHRGRASRPEKCEEHLGVEVAAMPPRDRVGNQSHTCFASRSSTYCVCLSLHEPSFWCFGPHASACSCPVVLVQKTCEQMGCLPAWSHNNGLHRYYAP